LPPGPVQKTGKKTYQRQRDGEQWSTYTYGTGTSARCERSKVKLSVKRFQPGGSEGSGGSSRNSDKSDRSGSHKEGKQSGRQRLRRRTAPNARGKLKQNRESRWANEKKKRGKGGLTQVEEKRGAGGGGRGKTKRRRGYCSPSIPEEREVGQKKPWSPGRKGKDMN